MQSAVSIQDSRKLFYYLLKGAIMASKDGMTIDAHAIEELQTFKNPISGPKYKWWLERRIEKTSLEITIWPGIKYETSTTPTHISSEAKDTTIWAEILKE